jgi:hypothetical protein
LFLHPLLLIPPLQFCVHLQEKKPLEAKKPEEVEPAPMPALRRPVRKAPEPPAQEELFPLRGLTRLSQRADSSQYETPRRPAAELRLVTHAVHSQTAERKERVPVTDVPLGANASSGL